MEDGVSQILAILLKSIFNNAVVQPQHGFLLKHPFGDTRVHFTWAMLLADGAAQNMTWTSKGDSGSKFCMLCANIRATGTNPDSQHNSTTKYHQLVLTNDQEVLDSYQRLHARCSTCSKNDFAMWEKASGWSYSSKALLLDQDLLSQGLLLPVSQFCHDYMHGVLQGTGPVVLFHFLCQMEEHLATWAFLEGYFPFFQYPKAWKCQHVSSYFTKKKARPTKAMGRSVAKPVNCLPFFQL